MSKNIHKLCLAAVVLVLTLSSCASTIKSNEIFLPSASVSATRSLPLNAIPANESESKGKCDTNRIAVLDEKFEEQMPEPDGSTASMLAYAESYLDLWQGEIDLLIANTPSLAQEFATFEAKLNGDLEAIMNEYSTGDGAPYGSAVSYELVCYKANALRDWLIKYYS